MKPSIPKGTRDFGPAETAKREYIFNTIRAVFKLYGYQAIETPSMENLSTLMGKYGEEGDKLLFKILNSGDFLKKANKDAISEGNSQKVTTSISDKGLRYDLTVPFARFVVQHQSEISFPFKRYQIQPVWRADRPQKGRYREFYQCDVDVVGSDSLLNELELIQIVSEVYKRFKLSTTLKINNRKILAGIAEVIGEEDRLVDITVAIDKLDKIGLDKVNDELIAKGISEEAVEKLQPILALHGTNEEKLDQIRTVVESSEVGIKGVDEICSIFSMADALELSCNIELDLTLARGLNYYTGAIFEVKSDDVAIGSITGGGRYDDLTSIFGLKGVSGVGISFGADRIYDVLSQLDLFPKESMETTQVMFVNFGDEEQSYIIPILAKLRDAGIRAEIYPDSVKMKKQIGYADKKNIPNVVLIGTSEIESGSMKLKDMSSGEQSEVTLEQLIDKLS